MREDNSASNFDRVDLRLRHHPLVGHGIIAGSDEAISRRGTSPSSATVKSARVVLFQYVCFGAGARHRSAPQVCVTGQNDMTRGTHDCKTLEAEIDHIRSLGLDELPTLPDYIGVYSIQVSVTITSSAGNQ